MFTTRPDTIFGATYMVIAPEHPILEKLSPQITNMDEVKKKIEPQKGEWIDVEEFYFDYKCSLCGGLSEFDTPFCQHCGAVMKEKV